MCSLWGGALLSNKMHLRFVDVSCINSLGAHFPTNFLKGKENKLLGNVVCLSKGKGTKYISGEVGICFALCLAVVVHNSHFFQYVKKKKEKERKNCELF